MRKILLAVAILLINNSISANDHNTPNPPPTDLKRNIILVRDQFSLRLADAELSHGELVTNIIKGKYHPELIPTHPELRSWEMDLKLDLSHHLNIPENPDEYYDIEPESAEETDKTLLTWIWLNFKSSITNLFSNPEKRVRPLKRERVLKFDEEKDRVAIINQSFTTNSFLEARKQLKSFYKKAVNPPLLITAAGNDTNHCTEEAAIINRHIGSDYQSLAAFFFGQPISNYQKYYMACPQHALAAMDLEVNDYFINVIGDLGNGTTNKPAGYLKERTVAAPYEAGGHYGTSMSTAYVTAVANMILTRAPEMPPPEIAQIIFITADKKGINELNETWGHGVVNPRKAMEYMDALGYPPLPQQSAE